MTVCFFGKKRLNSLLHHLNFAWFSLRIKPACCEASALTSARAFQSAWDKWPTEALIWRVSPTQVVDHEFQDSIHRKNAQ